MKPFILAPMAGINSTAFRLLCKENGADMIYTQMYDVNLIATKTKEEVGKLLNIREEERPIAVQLSGSNIDNFKKSVRSIEDFADIINLNAGCIENFYLDRNAGAVLLKDLDKLKKITRAMIACTKKPIDVKIRIGWDGQSINGVNVAKAVEEAGAFRIIVHGRTAMQKYAGKSNWTNIKQIKEKVSIPVIANGDVKSYQDGLDLMEKTGTDGVMIGREAKYKPWVFNKKELSQEEIIQQILRYIELYEKYENRNHLDEVRDQVFRMTRDVDVEKNKRAVKDCGSIKEVKEFIKHLLN